MEIVIVIRCSISLRSGGNVAALRDEQRGGRRGASETVGGRVCLGWLTVSKVVVIHPHGYPA